MTECLMDNCHRAIQLWLTEKFKSSRRPLASRRDSDYLTRRSAACIPFTNYFISGIVVLKDSYRGSKTERNIKKHMIGYE